jgi:cysteine desulfuration protein SufE
MKDVMDKIQDEIIQKFSKLNDWFEIYEYLIQIGKDFEIADEKILSDDFSLSGCQSKVWLKSEMINGKIHYIAYSDSLIVRGIISLLLNILNDKKPEDVVKADLYFIEKIGLKSNLSPSRSNGLMSIINYMKSFAEEAVKNNN